MKSKSNRKTTMARKVVTEKGGVYWPFFGPFSKAAVDVVNGMWNARECRYEKSI